MSFIELLLFAVSLSMDAFAVAICVGLKMPAFKQALTVGLYFGVFQAGMPIAGYYAASLFSEAIAGYDHWIVFVLLGYIGGKMIYEGLKKDDVHTHKEYSLKLAGMLPLAFATSVDAMAAGISFSFLHVEIIPSAALIGLTTFTISVIGVKIGSAVGKKFKSKAEIAGGIVLVLIGLKILLEHMNVINIS